MTRIFDEENERLDYLNRFKHSEDRKARNLKHLAEARECLERPFEPRR